MMARKEKRPSWFKLWLHHKPVIDAVPDDVVGRAVKAAMSYFCTGELPELGQLEMVVFAPIKSDIDEAHADYLRDVENGKKGGRPRMTDGEKPPVKEGNPPVPSVTERDGDGEREGEGEGDGKGSKANKPSTHSHFIPPTVEQVRAYCTENGYTVDPESFVDHYTANGWRVGGNAPMVDWKAKVRTWNKKENPNGKNESQPSWKVGTVV